jgi:CubicO group peptidase (beta-lactamase class C family)
MKLRSVALAAFLLAHATPPSSAFQSEHWTSPYDWPTSRPETEGLEPGVLASAYLNASQLTHLHSLLVVKNGYLVAEQYFNQQTAMSARPIASVTKSFTSALIGIALREGYLTNLDQKMLDFFPEHEPYVSDPRKHHITLRLMLQMRTGWPYDSTTEFGSQSSGSGNPMRYIIVEHELETDPGTTWAYSNAASILFSAILERASGISLIDLANWYLFEPMGTTIENWARDQQGYYRTEGHMELTARDLAAFGLLYLNRGVLGGRQIVPAKWVDESFVDYSRTTHGDVGPYLDIRYGYLWWHAEAKGYDVYFASGHGGNFVVIVPELDMVVVTTAHNFPGDFSNRPAESERNNLLLIANEVLPAAKDITSPPPYPPSNATGGRVANRSLFQTEHIDHLRWQSEPRNSGEHVTHYCIYRYQYGTRQRLTEVDSGTREYAVGEAETDGAVYGITAVTAEGEESIPAVVTVR